MVSNKPACDPKARYSQREAADLLGVERHTVRRWEEGGYIRFQIRKAGGRKFTTGAQIVKCWEACYL